MNNPIKLLTAMALLGLISCGAVEEIQPGERYTLDGQYIGNSALVNELPSAQFALQLPPVRRTDWSVHMGSPSNLAINAELAAAPSLRQNIDLKVNARRAVLGASDPIFAQGNLFHLDADGTVHSWNTSGDEIWSRSLVALGEDAGDGYGGGLAFQSNRLYAATGFGELIAMNASSGQELWRFKAGAPLRIAPVISGNFISIMPAQDELVTLNAQTGELIWRHYSAQATLPARVNSGVPAMAQNSVIAGFSSGEVSRINLVDGRVIWSLSSWSDQFFEGKSVIGDISADPVVDGNRVYIGSAVGIAALDLQTGKPIWQSEKGTKGNFIVAGNAIYILDKNNHFTILNKANGEVGRSLTLPKRAEDRFASAKLRYNDLRLANNAVWIFDDRAGLRKFDTHTQNLGERIVLGADWVSSPIMAQKKMIGITEHGRLAIVY